MEKLHDRESAPAYSSAATQNTLTTISEQLFNLQEQLLQLRLNMAEETQAASSTPVTENPAGNISVTPIGSGHLSIMNENDKAKPTLTPGTLEIEMTESPCLVRIRGRIDKIRTELTHKIDFIPESSKDGSPISDDILLAWNLAYSGTRYNECLCKQFEQLLKEEHEEMRHLHKLQMDHQLLLAMAHKGQNQGREGVIAGIDRLEKAISQFAASIATERTQTTVEAKHGSLPPQQSSTVSEVDKPTRSVLSSSAMQLPRVMEQEITSPYLMHIQARIELFGKTIYDISKRGTFPGINELSKEAIMDPSILAIWSQHSNFRDSCSALCYRMVMLQDKKEEELKLLCEKTK